MVHAVMAAIEPGEVLVLTMPEPAPVALVGELLATQAAARGAAALLVDAAVRDVEELASMGLPIWARWVRVRGATKTAVGAIDVPVRGRRLRRSARATRSCSTPTARRSSPRRASTRCSRPRARAPRRSASSARSSRRARSPTTSTGCARSSRTADGDAADLAHIHHAELLTPKPDESLRFFVDVLGMEIEAQDGRSVYLRGWGDYARYSLKLTEAASTGLGAPGDPRVEPRGARAGRPRRSRPPGAGRAGSTATTATAPPTASRIPTGTCSSSTTRPSATSRRPSSRPALKNQPQRYIGRGPRVKRLDHVNLLAADVRASREFAVDVLGYRLYERIELDDGTEAGAWMSLTIAAHELIYTQDAHRANGRLHHLAFWVDTREECLRAADIFLDDGVTIEAAPSKHAIAQGFFLYALRARRQPDRGHDRRAASSTTRTSRPSSGREAERAKGQAWGVKTVESFHTYGTPPVEPPRHVSGRPRGEDEREHHCRRSGRAAAVTPSGPVRAGS